MRSRSWTAIAFTLLGAWGAVNWIDPEDAGTNVVAPLSGSVQVDCPGCIPLVGAAYVDQGTAPTWPPPASIYAILPVVDPEALGAFDGGLCWETNEPEFPPCLEIIGCEITGPETISWKLTYNDPNWSVGIPTNWDHNVPAGAAAGANVVATPSSRTMRVWVTVASGQASALMNCGAANYIYLKYKHGPTGNSFNVVLPFACSDCDGGIPGSGG